MNEHDGSSDEYAKFQQKEQAERGFLAKSAFVIEGDDLINEINEVKIGEIQDILEDAVAFKDGLIFGKETPEFPQLETDSLAFKYYRDLFLSEESSSERPSGDYLSASVRNRIGSEIRGTKRKIKTEKRTMNDEELTTYKELIGLKNHFYAREIIDKAFIQRQETVNVDKQGADLVGNAPDSRLSIKPDKGHWEAAFNGDFGLKVDKVLRKIVDLGRYKENQPEILKKEGIKYSLYAEGFKSDACFKYWLTELLKEADGRMDVVWFTWRLALIWEIPSTIGISKKVTKDSNGNVTETPILPNSPISTDLFDWTAHLEEKRRMEFNVDLNDQRLSREKYITHTGYPLSIGKICTPTIGFVKDENGNIKRDENGKEKKYDVVDEPENVRQLSLSYLHDSKIDIEVKYKDGKIGKKNISLWEVWWKRKLKLGGDVDPKKNIPWSKTETSSYEQEVAPPDTEGFMMGSYGYWLLKRSRSYKLVNDVIRKRFSLKDLSEPDFFAGQLRTWDKVLGRIDKEKPEENPRNWWLAGIIVHSHPLLNTREIPLAAENPDRSYRTFTVGERWERGKVGTTEVRKSVISEIFNHGYQCGFLRKIDIEWLKNRLNISSGSFGGDEATRL